MVSACEEVRETDKTRASLSLSVIDLSFVMVYAGLCKFLWTAKGEQMCKAQWK